MNFFWIVAGSINGLGFGFFWVDVGCGFFGLIVEWVVIIIIIFFFCIDVGSIYAMDFGCLICRGDNLCSHVAFCQAISIRLYKLTQT